MTEAEVRLIRQRQVTGMTGLSRSRIYELMAKGKFPQSVHLGPKTVTWVEAEVRHWILQAIHRERGPRRRTSKLTRRSKRASAEPVTA